MYFTIKRTLCFFTFLSFSLTIISQNTTSLPDSLSSKSYIELSDLFYNSKPDTLKATIYAKAVYFKALKLKDTMKMLEGKYYLADIKNDESIYLNYCDSLIAITKKKPTKNFPNRIYVDRSKYYLQKNIIDKSLLDILKVVKTRKVIKNDSLFHIAKMFLGFLRSKQKKYKESNTLYKDVYLYALKKQYLKPRSDFYSLNINMVFSYINLKKYDSAYIYCDKAKSIFKKNKDSAFYLGNLNLAYASIHFKQKDFNKSIVNLKKANPFLIEDENYYALKSNFHLIARSYDSLKNHDLALKYYLKVDSLYQLYKSPSKILPSTYIFLTKHYKSKDDLKKQLYYLDKLIKVKNNLNNQYTKFHKTFTEEYDIPNLLSEKKTIISQLENRVQKAQRNKFIYISLLVIGFILIMYQLRKKSVYKKRFLALVNQENPNTKKPLIVKNTTNTIAVRHNIPKDIVSLILKELEVFEKKEMFLHADNSLQSLASKLNTNSSYLSKIINQHKNTTFSNYINNLRINYIVEKLKTNSLLRKYTIKAIASEVGFKNAESFSKAFYKVTDIKPSYFIKELEKKNTKH